MTARRSALPAAALAAALLLSACRSSRVGPVHIAPALQTLVPSSAVVLSGADLAAIRSTPLFHRFQSGFDPAALDSFTRSTGVDPARDLDESLTWSDGSNLAVLLRGNFSSAALQSRLKSSGARQSSYKNRTLWESPELAVWFPSANTAAAGSPAAVRASIDAQDSSLGIPAALRSQLDALPDNSQVWLVFTGGLDFVIRRAPQGSNLDNVIHMAQGVSAASLGLDLRSGLNLGARIDCKAPDDARRIRDALRGLIGIGRLSTPDSHPEMLKVFDAIEVNRDETHVRVTARLPQDLVDTFLNVWLKKK